MHLRTCLQVVRLYGLQESASFVRYGVGFACGCPPSSSPPPCPSSSSAPQHLRTYHRAHVLSIRGDLTLCGPASSEAAHTLRAAGVQVVVFTGCLGTQMRDALEGEGLLPISDVPDTDLDRLASLFGLVPVPPDAVNASTGPDPRIATAIVDVEILQFTRNPCNLRLPHGTDRPPSVFYYAVLSPAPQDEEVGDAAAVVHGKRVDTSSDAPLPDSAAAAAAGTAIGLHAAVVVFICSPTEVMGRRICVTLYNTLAKLRNMYATKTVLPGMRLRAVPWRVHHD